MTVFLVLSAVTLAYGARDRRWVAFLAVAGGLTAVGCVMLVVFSESPAVQQRFRDLVSDGYRPTIFEAVLRQAQVMPWTGTGPGTFLYYGRLFRVRTDGLDDIFAHNDWIQIAADFGFPALVLLAGVLVFHGVAGFRGLREILRRRMTAHARPQSNAAAILIGAAAGVAAAAVHSFFDFNMQIPANALVVSAWLGMVANPGVAPQGRPGIREAAGRRIFIVLASLGGLWLVRDVSTAAGPELFWLGAENARLAGRLGEAQILAETGLKSKEHSRLRQALGEVYLAAALGGKEDRERRKHGGTAVRHLEMAAGEVPLDGRNFLLLGQARRVEGRRAQAQEAMVEAIRLWPTLGVSYEIQAQLLESDGKLREARQFYLQAARMPWNPGAWKKAVELDKKIKILER
jgi:hypothetical protein